MIRPATLAACLLLSVSVLPAAAQAETCQRPQRPDTSALRTRDEQAITAFQRNLQSYTQRMNAYVQCVDRARASAVQESQEIKAEVDAFVQAVEREQAQGRK